MTAPPTGPVLVQLINGEYVQSCAEEWRRECLARHVLCMPFEQRRPWIDKHAKMASAEAAELLRADVTALHGAGK